MGRKAMVLSLVAMLLLACGDALRAADEAKSARVKVVVIKGIQIFPVLIMQTKGIADKHRLQIEQVEAAGPQALYTIMQTGDFHVSFGGWLTIALMRAQGHKVTNVYSMMGYLEDVMVMTDSPLKNMADLKGKRIGLFAGPTGATTWFFRLVAVKFFGFDPMKESKVHYGAPPLLIGMMERGELDAVLTLEPQVTQLLESGKFRSIASIGDMWREKTGQNPMLLSVTMNESWAKANPAVATRFVAAYKETLTYLKTHPEVGAEIAKAMGIKTEQGAKLLHQRSSAIYITRWDQKFIEEQYAYAAELIKIFGEPGDVPRQIPEGTFDMSYAR